MKIIRASIIGFALAIVAAVVAAHAQADPVKLTVSATMPTKRENGAALALSELATMNAYVSADTLAETKTAFPAIATTVTGTVSFELAQRALPYTVTVNVTAVDKNGLESKRAAVSIPVPVPISPPGSPGTVRILVECIGTDCTAKIQ